MSEMSEMVFVAFTQHCIQSTDFMSEILYCTLYTVAPRPSKGEGYLDLQCIWAFHPVGLAVHHQSVWGGSFVNFLGLDNYKGDCRQDAQPIPNS